MSNNQYLSYVRMSLKAIGSLFAFIFASIYYGLWIFIFGFIGYILFSLLADLPVQASIGIALLIYVARHVLVPGRAAARKRIYTGSSGSGGAFGTGGGGC